MYDFVSQVAPVPYPDEFPFREQLLAAARESGIAIDEVKITVKDGSTDARPVFKRYGDKYEFESGKITLSACTTYSSPLGGGGVGLERRMSREPTLIRVSADFAYPNGFLQRQHRLPSDTLIYDLQFKLRCRQCRRTSSFRIAVYDSRQRGDNNQPRRERVIVPGGL